MAKPEEFNVGDWVKVKHRKGKWQVMTKKLHEGCFWYSLEGDEGNTIGAETSAFLTRTPAPSEL